MVQLMPLHPQATSSLASFKPRLRPLNGCSSSSSSGTHTHTHTHLFNGPFPGLPRWAGARKVKPIWILLKQETMNGSGISWAICKSAPCSRQITTPVWLVVVVVVVLITESTLRTEEHREYILFIGKWPLHRWVYEYYLMYSKSSERTMVTFPASGCHCLWLVPNSACWTEQVYVCEQLA